MSILTAEITKVQIGLIEIDGLMDIKGTYYVAIPQLTQLNLVQKNRSLKVLESSLGIEFQSNKKFITAINPKAVNAITLSDFILVLKIQAKRGNEFAIELIDQLVGLSLQQLFSDAFNIKFGKEERQQWLIKRQITKQTFWWFTDEIKYWLDHRDEPSSNPQVHYIMAFKAMSVGLFGKTPKTIKEELSVKKSDLNRDHFGKESLGRIEAIQRLAKANLTIVGARPKESVEQAVYAFRYPIMDYKL